MKNNQRIWVLGVPFTQTNYDGAVKQISAMAMSGRGHYVCICNAHSVVTAKQDPAHANALINADLCTPDGAPVAWMLRRLGFRDQQRVNGPDLMLRYCEHAAATSEPLFLYGSTPETLHSLAKELKAMYPNLIIAGCISPPFRQLTQDENSSIVASINSSGARTVWVSLGCPKQEAWMRDHRTSINAVMVGVGAAFDYHAGTIARAPLWMQNAGLEWLHRLASEPRRLWKRYLITNSLFIAYAIQQLLSRFNLK